jgi:endonuclease/exonuclease/phosphatase family metal-dependent hydrolase
MRVVSFNVLVSLRSPAAPLRARAPGFCRELTELDVDVLLLQEVWTRPVLRFIGARLPSLPHVAWRPGLAGQPAGGLVTFSRWPLRRAAFHPFAGARVRRGSPFFRGMSALNTRLQGVLTVTTADGSVIVANTHLTANRDGDWSESNRYHGLQRAQLRMLHDAVRRAGAAPLAVLGGDFNVPSGSPLYPMVVDNGAWRDPFAAADRPTYRAEFLPAGRPGHRIDYLLVNADADRHPVTEADLVLDGPDAASDHYALLTGIGGPP